MDYFNAKTEHIDCGAFNCCYIQYPLTVQGIDTCGIEDYLSKTLQFDRVRPVGDARTYTGFYLGELYMSPSISYNRKSGMLTVALSPNPAIYVPELGRIVFGYESWWSKAGPEAVARDITNADIESQPYVQFFKTAGNAYYRREVHERLKHHYDGKPDMDAEGFTFNIVQELDSSDVGPLSIENAKALVPVLAKIFYNLSSETDIKTATKDAQEILCPADSHE